MVPTLEYNDEVVYESGICNEYLDEKYTHNRLLPQDPYQKARAKMLMDGFDKVSVALHTCNVGIRYSIMISGLHLKFNNGVVKVQAVKGAFHDARHRGSASHPCDFPFTAFKPHEAYPPPIDNEGVNTKLRVKTKLSC